MNLTPKPLSRTAGLSPLPTGRECIRAMEETQTKVTLFPCCAHVYLGITQTDMPAVWLREEGWLPC